MRAPGSLIIFAEVSERYFGVAIGAVNQVGPGFELGVVGDTALQGDRIKLGQSGRDAAGAGIAAHPVGYQFCRAFKSADFASDLFALPFLT